MTSKHFYPNDPEYQDSNAKGDPMPYGRRKNIEKQKMVEYMDRLRERKVEQREDLTASLSSKAPHLGDPYKNIRVANAKSAPKTKISKYLSGSKGSLSKRFANLNEALAFANQLAGEAIPQRSFYKKNEKIYCKLSISQSTFSAGIVQKTLKIKIEDTKSAKPGKRYMLTARLLNQ